MKVPGNMSAKMAKRLKLRIPATFRIRWLLQLRWISESLLVVTNGCMAESGGPVANSTKADWIMIMEMSNHLETSLRHWSLGSWPY
jgi:hypothetical protein